VVAVVAANKAIRVIRFNMMGLLGWHLIWLIRSVSSTLRQPD
jgi:hypothetical protein